MVQIKLVVYAEEKGPHVCHRCGGLGLAEPHPCCYDLEINDGSEHCYCCQECREECYRDT